MTRVTAYLEGRVYSTEEDGNIRIWEIRDELLPAYPYEQVFIPTVIREVSGQTQSSCIDPTVSWETEAQCLEAMNFMYSSFGTEDPITDQYGAAECRDGFWVLYQWCPAFSPETYTEHVLQGVTDQHIVIKGEVRNAKGKRKSKFRNLSYVF